MTTFAQALARIEELLKGIETAPYNTWKVTTEQNLKHILYTHADSIVQLGKVAAQMRGDIDMSDGYLGPGAMDYDKLMNDGEG